MCGRLRLTMMILNPKESSTMKSVVVSKHKNVNDGVGYAEIGQSQHTKQALLMRNDASFTRITGFVLCRDFLVDSYSYAKVKKDFGIYGFSFKGSQMQPDWTGAHIQMHFSDAESRENFLKHIPQIMHKIEKSNQYKLTEIMEIEGNKLDLVAVGDVKWLQNCLSFSLWSLLLRVCCYSFDATKDWIKEFGSLSTSDSLYISSVPRKTLDKVLDDLSNIATDTFCGFDPANPNVGVGMIHHNSGFISVFGHHTEINPSTVKKNAHWQEMQKRGLQSKVAA